MTWTREPWITCDAELMEYGNKPMPTEVGRIYLEGASGYVAQATYRKHVLLRAPVLAWGGQRWEQTRKLMTGEWVYRATEQPGSKDLPDDSALDLVCHEGDIDYVRPSDLPPAPDPHHDALELLINALALLTVHDPTLAASIRKAIAEAATEATGDRTAV